MSIVRNSQRGLTLIEIMIVLAILGSVLALVGSRVFGQRDKANQRQARLGMATIQEQLEMYAADCGDYPGSLDALISDPGDDCGGWSGPYLKESQLKDPWNTEFVYEQDGGGYSLKSLGKDRRDGGTGVDKDIESE